jgi:hypothetical protein
MIIEGQVHGGLADGVGMALMELISFDEEGNCLSGSFMDYLLPTALEVPSPELGATVTPSPHHPVGAKGVGESATVGSPAAVVNSVLDALAPFGVVHADMPLTPAAVWTAIHQARANRPAGTPRNGSGPHSNLLLRPHTHTPLAQRQTERAIEPPGNRWTAQTMSLLRLRTRDPPTRQQTKCANEPPANGSNAQTTSL